MAIVRGLDGRFYDIDDETLKKHEIKPENVPPDRGPPGQPAGQGIIGMPPLPPVPPWLNWQNWEHPWKQHDHP